MEPLWFRVSSDLKLSVVVAATRRRQTLQAFCTEALAAYLKSLSPSDKVSNAAPRK